MINLEDARLEIDQAEVLPDQGDYEYEGPDCLRLDYNSGQNSLWLYANGDSMGTCPPEAEELVKRLGFMLPS